MMKTTSLALFAALALPVAAAAAPVTLPLDPDHSRVSLRGYAFGLTPTDGQFNAYKGTLTLSPPGMDTCTVDMTLQAKSLKMSMGMVTDMVLAPDFLDPDKYPELVYHGTCRSNGAGKLPTLAGQLTMHGQTHPFDMAVTYKNGVLTTAGTLKREEWGVNGRETMIGHQVKVTVTVRLPDSVHFDTPAD